MGEGDDKGGDIGGGAGHASFVKSFFRDFVEDMGIEDKFPAERTVELMIVRTVVRSGYILDISSSIFMSKYESMLQICTMDSWSLSFHKVWN